MSASSSSSQPPVTPELEIKSILLLDDDVELGNTLKELLEARNFVVTTVTDGAAGLHEVIAMDFDLIVCDMMMPGMPGDMFYLAVKKMKPAMAERFLFVTGHGDNPKVNAFLKSIDAPVVFKPVLSEDLLRMMSLVFQRTAAHEPL